MVDEAGFADECIAAASRYIDLTRGTVGKPLVTVTPSGNLICRIDVAKLGPLIDRVVIHRDEEARLAVNVAVGQWVAPLETWAAAARSRESLA